MMNASLDIQTVLEPSLPFVLFFVTLTVGLILRRQLVHRLTRSAEKTNAIDPVMILSLKRYVLLWVLMLASYLAVTFSSLPQSIIPTIHKILFILVTVSITLALSSFVSQWIKVYSGRFKTGLPVVSLTQHTAQILIFIIGLLILLNRFGISITPILATLGVGSLAIALALQDTFSNFFSGCYIIMAQQIKVGHYIKLHSGEEGYVADITWRTTHIRMLPNNIILVPNEKLTKAIVTNYYLPVKEMAVLVDLGVHYKNDLKKIEQVTCEVAKTVMEEVAGGVPHFEPFIRYHTFSDSGIHFTVTLRVKEFFDQYLIKHELIKRLHARYEQEGIVIPHPILAINYKQESG